MRAQKYRTRRTFVADFLFALRHVVEWADENQRPYNPPDAWSASPERKYRVLDVDIPTSKRPIYSRSSYPSVPLLSLIVSPASEQRPKSSVRSELSTPCVFGMRGCPIESSFSPSRPISRSLARQPRNLFDFNHFRVFSIHFPSVFDARLARARPGILFYRFRLFSMGSGACRIYESKTLHYTGCRIPTPSVWSPSALWTKYFYLYIFLFFFSTLPFCTFTQVPFVFHRMHGTYSMWWSTILEYALPHRVGFDEGPLLKGEHACFRIPNILFTDLKIRDIRENNLISRLKKILEKKFFFLRTYCYTSESIKVIPGYSALLNLFFPRRRVCWIYHSIKRASLPNIFFLCLIKARQTFIREFKSKLF